tara:strand:- start:427 stop:870 length:444 start_codon:yes stop_codon:yes gene_type:complete
MYSVANICISSESGKKMESMNSIKVIANKGIVNDRYFKENNDKNNQITLIESENVDYYNKISGTNFIPTDFRRNVITKGISLNKLVGKEILIGEVRLKIHDLCEPCRYLQELLGEKNLVKKLLNRGGLRCELLTNGNINVNDPIKIL